MQAKDYYLGVIENGKTIIESSFQSSNCAHITSAHAFLKDFQTWISILDRSMERREIILYRAAYDELQVSITSALLGHYRQAHASIRFALETALTAIYLSTNIIALSKWIKNEQDSKWQLIIDRENGVFSNNFANALFEECAPKQHEFRALAASLYRECSEFVHGNLHTLTPVLYTFSEDKLNHWGKTYLDSKKVINYALLIRYVKELHVDDVRELEALITDDLFQFDFVRTLYC